LRRMLPLQVGPAESRIEHRQVRHPRLLRRFEVFLPGAGGCLSSAFHSDKVADVPRADDVEAAEYPGPFSVLLPSPPPLPPHHLPPTMSVTPHVGSLLKKSMMWLARFGPKRSL